MLALVLLSGGLDSIVAAHRATGRDELGGCVTVDYGQPAAPYEIEAARRFCELVGARHDVARVSGDCPEMRLGAGEGGARVVPGRNLMLISLAIPYAVRWGCRQIAIGATSADAANYPDCRLEFLAAASETLRAAYGVSVTAPLLNWSRDAVRKYAERQQINHLAWSCYEPTPQGEQCGRCDSCRQ